MLYCEGEKIHLSPFWIGLQFSLCQTSKNLAPIDRMMAHFSQMRRLRAWRENVNYLRLEMSDLRVRLLQSLYFFRSTLLICLTAISGSKPRERRLQLWAARASYSQRRSHLTALSCSKKPLSCFWRLNHDSCELPR